MNLIVKTIVIIAALGAGHAFADDRHTPVKTGEVECVVFKQTEASGCSVFDSGNLGCAGPVDEVKRYRFDITAPAGCLKDPLFCEGGSMHSSQTNVQNIDGRLFKARFDEEESLKVGIVDGDAEMVSDSATVLQTTEKTYFNASLSYKTGDVSYWFNCNADEPQVPLNIK